MPFILRPPHETLGLTQRLQSLAQNRRLVRLLTGFLGVLAVVVLGLTLAAISDAAWNVPPALRAIVLAVGVAGLVILATRWVGQPAREPLHAERVAHLLESRHPVLNDALASAVGFLETPSSTGVSTAFRRAAIHRAEKLSEQLEYQELIPTAALTRVSVAALGVMVLTAIFVLVNPARAGLCALRLLDPFGSHPWPPETTIELLRHEGQRDILARGQPHSLNFQVRGMIPVEATVWLKLAGAQPTHETVPLNPSEGLNEVAARVTLLPDRIPRDFEFRITANDADTGWRSMTVADPPRLVLLDGRPSPHIQLVPPAYSQQKPTSLPEGSGAVETVCGTRIRLRAMTDRPVVSAVLVPHGDPAAIRTANAAASVAGLATHPLGGLSSAILAEKFASPRVVSIDREGRLLELDFSPSVTGLLDLQFTDEVGLRGSRLLDVRTFLDPVPVVTIERHAPTREPLYRLATAKMNLRSRADDRTFALRRFVLEYRINDEPFREIVLEEVGSQRPPALEAERSFGLNELASRNGQSLGDGDILVLRTAAADWDDHTLGKPAGRSGEIEIRIHSEDSLNARIQRELTAIRPELNRARESQKEALERTTAAVKSLTPEGQLTPAGRDQLQNAESSQKQTRNQVSDPRDGIRAKAERLRETAKANELHQSTATKRADAVARITGDLEERGLPEIEPQLANAKQSSESPREALTRAMRQQQRALEKLDAAAEELEQWAAASEVRGDARQLKDEVARAAATSRGLSDQSLGKKTPEQLTAEERTATEKAAEALEKAADRANKLLSKLDQVADEKRNQATREQAAATGKAAEASRETARSQQFPPNSPESRAAAGQAQKLTAEANRLKESAAREYAEANALEQSAEAAGRQAIAEDLRKAAEAQQSNRSREAARQAESAMQRLDAMTANLNERPEDRVDELAKKRKAGADRVDELADRQDELAKKVTKASQNNDAAARQEAFQKLAEQQEELRRETEQLSRQLDREGANNSADNLRQAAQQMELSRDELQEGRDPESKPDEALDRLEDAKRELAAKPDETQLDREAQEQLIKPIQAFLEKQESAIQEATRLSEAARTAKKWERPLLASLASLGESQKSLAEELRRFSEEKAKELKVFDRLFRGAADEMVKSATRIQERKADAALADPTTFDVETEKAADDQLRKPMQSALRRLQHVVGSLKESAKKPPQRPTQPMGVPGGGGGQGGGRGAGGGQGNRGVPPIAQLKALRDWQHDVNERTAAFAKTHPKRDRLNDDDKDDLQEIEQAQKEIAELLAELRATLLQQNMGGDQP